MAGQPRQLDRADLERDPRRARRAPAGPQRAPRPGRRASRRRGSRPGRAAGPPARRGRAGPRRHARSRTARRRDGPGRGRGPRHGPRDRDGATTRGSPGPRHGHDGRDRGLEEAGLLAGRFDEQRPPRRQRDREGQAGRPPPEPMSTNASIPIARRSGTAVRLSRTCATATSPGSRMAVRLIAAVQARSSRTWPSMAARCAAVRTSPSPSSPASRASSYAAGSGGRPSTRVGSGSRAGCRARLLYHVPIVPRRATPGVIVSHHERDPVLRPSVRFMAGSPRTPRGPPYPGCPSADDGRYAAARGESTRLSTNCPGRPGIVDKSRARTGVGRPSSSGRWRGPGVPACAGRRR